jgi:hypothetical protein
MTHFIGLMFPQHVGYDSDIMLSGERGVCPRFLRASSLRKLYMRLQMDRADILRYCVP